MVLAVKGGADLNNNFQSGEDGAIKTPAVGADLNDELQSGAAGEGGTSGEDGASGESGGSGESGAFGEGSAFCEADAPETDVDRVGVYHVDVKDLKLRPWIHYGIHYDCGKCPLPSERNF